MTRIITPVAPHITAQSDLQQASHSHQVDSASVALAESSESLTPFTSILASAREQAERQQLPFAGTIRPFEAWQLFREQLAVLVDVRTHEERSFVGYVPGTIHVPWATGTSLTRNPRFAKELENKLKDKTAVVLLLCRSGKRSAAAAEAATKAGFSQVFNIAEGFEGDLNAAQQRGTLGGWRLAGLPWVQD